MRISPIYTSKINNKAQSKDASFGYGVMVEVKDFTSAGRTLRNPVKIRQLREIKECLLDQQMKLREKLDEITNRMGANPSYMPSIKLKFKIAEGSIPQVSVGLVGYGSHQSKPIKISSWIDNDGNVLHNEKRLMNAVEIKAVESAKRSKGIEDDWEPVAKAVGVDVRNPFTEGAEGSKIRTTGELVAIGHRISHKDMSTQKLIAEIAKKADAAGINHP